MAWKRLLVVWTVFALHSHLIIEGLDAAARLREDELNHVFGAGKPIPEYSLFVPKIRFDAGGRTKRDASNSSVFEFSALGQTFEFRLRPVENLVSPHFAMIRRDDRESKILDFEARTNCAFQGVDTHDGRNAIALVMCKNMRGVVKGPRGELVIEPLPEAVSNRRRFRRSVRSGNEYIVYRRTERKACPIRREVFSSEVPKREYLFSRYSENVANSYHPTQIDQQLRFSHHVPKVTNQATNSEPVFDIRPEETFYIETAVFIDRDLLRLMEINFPSNTEEQVIEVVLAMVNAVQLLYNDPSLGNKINFVLKRLELLYNDPPGLSRPHDIDVFLTKFCLWQNVENPTSDEDTLHWDHALILTGLDLYTIMDDRKLNSQVVGLAPVAGMCTRTSSCTVNEGRHFESVYVVAHEIGHNLGMRHDGLQSGNNCDPSGYLMSPTLGSGKVTWSHCSKRYLTNFLRLSQSKCLRDKPLDPPQNIDHEGPLLPGERFSSDQQCLLKNGVGSRASYQQPRHEVCGDLHCIKDGYTWTSHPALEGTSCGLYRWCRRGECVQSVKRQLSSGTSLSKDIEEEEEEEVWSECKSPCLYGQDGILSSGSTGLSLSEKRLCRTCRSDYRYKVCSAVKQCSFREKKTLQDFANQMCMRLMREDPSLSGYADRVSVQGIKRCEVVCLRNDGSPTLSRASYPDGTFCRSSSEYPGYCIGGFCTEFTCQENSQYEAGPAICRSNSFSSPGRSTPSSPLLPTERNQFHDSSSSVSSSESSWGPWIESSDCRFSCISPSKGIRLVSRSCLSLRGCDGLNRNIHTCTPQRTNCETVKSPFKYASEICSRYSKSVHQLSGVGMQLSSTTEDPNRACTVACQDAKLKYRFYRVTGSDGWFPFGTECSSENGNDAYCLNGICLEFNPDGTPLRSEDTSSSSLLRPKVSRALSFFTENVEEATPLLSPLRHIGDDLMESQWRIKRDLRPSAHRLPGSFHDSYLLSLVDQINATFSEDEHLPVDGNSSIDLINPIFSDRGFVPATSASSKEETKNQKKANGSLQLERNASSKYKWKLYHSPCSVTCGEGVMKQTFDCVSETGKAVDSAFCPKIEQRRREVKCLQFSCPRESRFEMSKMPSLFSKWITSVVNDVKAKYP